MDEAARWMMAAPLAFFALRTILDNGFSTDGKGAVPLLGGLTGALAFLLCPIAGSHVWAWVPAMLDVGSNPVLAAVLSWRRVRLSR
jgi:hypothetical protein